MNREIETVLLNFLREEVFDPSTNLKINTNLPEAGLDSLALLRLLHFVEEKINVRIPESEITQEHISTIGNLTELIVSLKK